MRCIGTTTAQSQGAVSNDADVFVTKDNKVEVRLSNPHTLNPTCVFNLEPEILIELAHQLIAADLLIKERWGIQ